LTWEQGRDLAAGGEEVEIERGEWKRSDVEWEEVKIEP